MKIRRIKEMEVDVEVTEGLVAAFILAFDNAPFTGNEPDNGTSGRLPNWRLRHALKTVINQVGVEILVEGYPPPAPAPAKADPEAHTCDRCGKPATDCYREGSGTGHSEHVCACEEHGESLEDSVFHPPYGR